MITYQLLIVNYHSIQYPITLLYKLLKILENNFHILELKIEI
jgi:hypothetical protein